MFALEHPDQFKFVRSGRPEPLPKATIDAAWERVLVGRAHHEMMSKALGNPSEALLAKLRDSGPKVPKIIPGPAQKKT